MKTIETKPLQRSYCNKAIATKTLLRSHCKVMPFFLIFKPFLFLSRQNSNILISPWLSFLTYPDNKYNKNYFSSLYREYCPVLEPSSQDRLVLRPRAIFPGRDRKNSYHCINITLNSKCLPDGFYCSEPKLLQDVGSFMLVT